MMLIAAFSDQLRLQGRSGMRLHRWRNQALRLRQEECSLDSLILRARGTLSLNLQLGHLAHRTQSQDPDSIKEFCMVADSASTFPIYSKMMFTCFDLEIGVN